MSKTKYGQSFKPFISDYWNEKKKKNINTKLVVHLWYIQANGTFNRDEKKNGCMQRVFIDFASLKKFNDFQNSEIKIICFEFSFLNCKYSEPIWWVFLAFGNGVKTTSSFSNKLFDLTTVNLSV